VQLRDGTGGVITISHSSATSVVNHSRNWSRVDYAVAIDTTADVERAIALVRDAIHAVAASNADGVSASGEPIEWIGLDGLSRDGIVVRARIRTGPLRQYSFQRELNLRVNRAFAGAKIGYGAPVPTITPSS
jgi:moderate conductance mechanosensitive channel